MKAFPTNFLVFNSKFRNFILGNIAYKPKQDKMKKIQNPETFQDLLANKLLELYLQEKNQTR